MKISVPLDGGEVIYEEHENGEVTLTHNEEPDDNEWAGYYDTPAEEDDAS